MSVPLISIVIPCYNASAYISETIRSILNQDETNLEVIVVDDGSKDDSKKIIHSLQDSRIHYFYQANQGVSVARNNGFKHVTGKYVFFFDADDIMPLKFISSRIDYLEKNHALDFVCGNVQKFNEKGLILGHFRGTSANVSEEVLLYNTEVITCPSNYCFRVNFLLTHGLLFNPQLSSTADKYFLIQCSLYGKSFYFKDLPVLHYRVSQNSMSHKLTQALVLDNETYYKELIKNDLVPLKIRNKSLFLGDFILFASYWKINMRHKALLYGMKGFFRNPLQFVKKCLI